MVGVPLLWAEDPKEWIDMVCGGRCGTNKKNSTALLILSLSGGACIKAVLVVTRVSRAVLELNP